MYVRKATLNGAQQIEEASRLDDFFSLLDFVRRRRYEPTTVEWLLIQDCLDDTFNRSADTWCILFTLMAIPLRGRRSSLTRLLPLYAGLVGWDMGLRDRNSMPATDFFNSIIRVNSELGEAARRIYVPENFSATGDLNDKIPCGFLPAAREIVRSLTLEHVFRTTFFGSWAGVNLAHGGHGFLRLRIGCRYWSATIFDWRRNADGTHALSFGPAEAVACGPTSNAGKLLRNRQLILERTQHLANWWWRLTLSCYEWCSL